MRSLVEFGMFLFILLNFVRQRDFFFHFEKPPTMPLSIGMILSKRVRSLVTRKSTISSLKSLLMYKFLVCPTFRSILKKALKPYPKSLSHVKHEISALGHGVLKGDLVPGFSPLSIRKLRIGLKAYRLSKRSGLRLIYAFDKNNGMITPLHIYKKGAYKQENKVILDIKSNLKAMLHERQMDTCECLENLDVS